MAQKLQNFKIYSLCGTLYNSLLILSWSSYGLGWICKDWSLKPFQAFHVNFSSPGIPQSLCGWGQLILGLTSVPQTLVNENNLMVTNSTQLIVGTYVSVKKWWLESQYTSKIVFICTNYVDFKDIHCIAVVRLSLIHIWRCRRSTLCRSRWSPYH